jgi:hypothetical protein
MSKSLPQLVANGLASSGLGVKTRVDAMLAVVGLVCQQQGLVPASAPASAGSLATLDTAGALLPADFVASADTSEPRTARFAKPPAAASDSPSAFLTVQIIQVAEHFVLSSVVESWSAPGAAIAGPFGVEIPCSKASVPAGTDALSLLAPLWNPGTASEIQQLLQRELITPAAAQLGLEPAAPSASASASASSASSSAASTSALTAQGASSPMWSTTQVPRPSGVRSSPKVPGLADSEPLPPRRGELGSGRGGLAMPDRGMGAAAPRFSHPDLDPAGPGPGGMRGGGGMLIGPDHPGFGLPGGGMGRIPGGLPGGVPGARFDPVGPGVPMPHRGARGRGRGIHPDLLQPPGMGTGFPGSGMGFPGPLG